VLFSPFSLYRRIPAIPPAHPSVSRHFAYELASNTITPIHCQKQHIPITNIAEQAIQ
jgi:hypothetical protein